MKIIIAIILVFAIFGVITFFVLRKLISSTGQTLDENQIKLKQHKMIYHLSIYQMVL